MKKKSSVLFAIPLLLLFAMFVGGSLYTRQEELPIVYTEGNSVIDVENLEEVVGYGDYVFVAKIEEEIETIYKNVDTTSSGRKVGRPFTVYSITVIDNIKGKLKKNTPIEFQKFGGVSINGEHMVLQEGDSLLNVGDYYILVAGAGADGTLGQTGPTSSILLDAASQRDVVSSKSYKDFKEIVKNEVKYDRKRFEAKDAE